MATTPDVQAHLESLIQGGRRLLILDFSLTAYLASMGLRMLLTLDRQARAVQGRIVLAGLSPQLRHVLEITGFLTSLKACDDVEHALECVLAG